VARAPCSDDVHRLCSAGLVALALMATATKIGTAFYTFGVIVLATLTFVGLVTYERVLQSAFEDHGYAERIARLRSYYFDWAPELLPYLASVPPARRLAILGLRGGLWQGLRTIAGMIGVVTSVLAGSAAGLLAVIAAGHSALAGFVSGAAVGAVSLTVLMWYQHSAWQRILQLRMFEDSQDKPVAD
jgi:hypothetical protein